MLDEEALKARVGTRVRSLRKNAGLSLEELAHRAGVHETHLSGIERGVRNPTLLVLGRIAEGLGVDLETLVDTRDALTSAMLRQHAAARVRRADPEMLRRLLRLLDALE